MTDRVAQLEAALRAENALIVEAQRLLTAYIQGSQRAPPSTACSSSSTARSGAGRGDWPTMLSIGARCVLRHRLRERAKRRAGWRPGWSPGDQSGFCLAFFASRRSCLAKSSA